MVLPEWREVVWKPGSRSDCPLATNSFRWFHWRHMCFRTLPRMRRDLFFDTWPHLRGLELADPDPLSQHPIHMLIGLNLFLSILVSESPRLGPKELPVAQKTVFGWILSGPADVTQPDLLEAHVSLCIDKSDTHSLLRKFWKEEVPQKLSPTEEDEQCEKHFVSTHSRTTEGRYIVKLPFKADPPIDIGGSLQIATALYAWTESRLHSRPEISRPYYDFLREYLELGHMESVSEKISPVYEPVYIPHHAVIKESSSTTKLRVVFNASCRTHNAERPLVGRAEAAARSAGHNRVMAPMVLRIHCGHRQDVLSDNGRTQGRWLLADTVATDARIFTATLSSPYRLTYDLAPAPYLAMRVLQQLASDDGHRFPAAVPIIANSIYVDDTFFSQDSIHELRETRDQLIGLMKGGGFQLRKWAIHRFYWKTSLRANTSSLTIF